MPRIFLVSEEACKARRPHIKFIINKLGAGCVYYDIGYL